MSALVAGLAALEAEAFADAAIEAITKQTALGSTLVFEEWGDAGPSNGDRVECGCALTLLIQDTYGPTLANDLIDFALPFEVTEKAAAAAAGNILGISDVQAFAFLCGFDDKEDVESSKLAPEWIAAGQRVRAHFTDLGYFQEFEEADTEPAPPPSSAPLMGELVERGLS